MDDGRTRKDPSRQYGTSGKIQGTKYMLLLTWNAPEDAFDNQDQYLFEGRSVDDIFVSDTSTYKLYGAVILPSFACFNAVKSPSFKKDVRRYKLQLNQIKL